MGTITNFPNGFLAGVSVRGVPILQTQPGNVYWVGNGPPQSSGGYSGSTRFAAASDNNPGTFQKPLATIAQALLLCGQCAGDIIIVKPGHVEVCNATPSTTQAANMAPVYDPTGTIIVSRGGSAGYNFQMNVANVAIVGLGSGGNRPQIQFTTSASANILVTAAGMSIQNFLFVGDFAAVASAFTLADASCATTIITGNVAALGTVTRTAYPGMELVATSANGILPGTIILSQSSGAAGATGNYIVNKTYSVATTSATVVAGPTDFDIELCEVRDVGTALNIISLVTGSAGANGSDGLRVANTRFDAKVTSAAGGTLVTLGAGVIDRLIINDNFVSAPATATGASLLIAGAVNITNAEIGRNLVNHPTTVGTGIAITSSGSASTGLVHENLVWSLATSTGLLITTGTGLGFAQNYCTITGAADKQATLNPLAV